jgi:indolepyruvate ferredoxin oxidoreductase alpha subunit
VAEGIAYQYVKDIFPEAAVLKLGWAWPYPDALLRSFASGVENLVVVEENEEILEEHMLAIGIACLGRGLMSGIGEMTGDKLLSLRSALAQRGIVDATEIQAGGGASAARPKDPELPGRPPVLCPGCPHRGVFHALGRHDVVVTGDIGCYSLGVFPPLSRTDAILCMGGGFSMAQGMAKAGEKRRVVGVVGDSTFFHSGITGLIDVVYNAGGPECKKPVLIVLDNRTTAMTGHQDHPGTGRTLMGEKSYAASIEEIARACGMKNVYTINPYDTAQTKDCLARAVADPEPSLIVARAPCPLRERQAVGPLCSIDQERCKGCGACLKLGCPAIESAKGGKPVIKQNLCAGCGLCAQACAFKAISATEAEK